MSAKSNVFRIGFVVFMATSTSGAAALFWARSASASICKPVPGYECKDQVCPAGIQMINGEDGCTPHTSIFGTITCTGSCSWVTGGGGKTTYCSITKNTVSCTPNKDDNLTCGDRFDFACAWAPVTKTCCPAAAPPPGTKPSGEGKATRCSQT